MKKEKVSEEQLENMRKEMNRFAIMASEFRLGNETMKKENEDLQSRTETAKEKIEKLEGLVRQLEDKEKEMMDRVKAREVEISDINDKRNALSLEVQDLITQRDQLVEDTGKLDRKYKELHDAKNKRLAEIAERESLIKSNEAGLLALQQELAARMAIIDKREELFAMAEKAK